MSNTIKNIALAGFMMAFILNGCVFTKGVQKMSADKYEIKPLNLIQNLDGQVAVKSEITIQHGKKYESKTGYIYAPKKIFEKTLKKAKSRKVAVENQQKIKIHQLEIRVEHPTEEAWRLAAADLNPHVGESTIPNQIHDGASHNIKDIMNYNRGTKIYSFQINKIDLDKKLSRVPSGKITFVQVILFVPAVLLDIVTFPLQLKMLGGGDNVPIL